MGFFSGLKSALNPFDGKVFELPPGLDKLPGAGGVQKSLDATVNKVGNKVTDSLNATVGRLPGVPDLPGGTQRSPSLGEALGGGVGAVAPGQASAVNPNQGILDQLSGAGFADLSRPEQIAIEKQAQAAAGTSAQGAGANASIIEMLQGSQANARTSQVQPGAQPGAQPGVASQTSGFAPGGLPGAQGFNPGQPGAQPGVPPGAAPVQTQAPQSGFKKFQDDLNLF